MEIRISDELNDIIRYARDEAMRTGSYGIGPDHLFLGVLRHGDNAAFRTVTGLGIDADNFKRFIDSHIFTNEPIPYAESDKISFTRYAQNVLSITVLEASKQGVTEANSLHLLLALCRTTENYGQAYLRQHGVCCRICVTRGCWVRIRSKRMTKVRMTSRRPIRNPNRRRA